MVLTLALAGCDAGYRHPFRVGTSVWPGYEPLHLAADLGDYEGSQIKMVELSNASSVARALRNGMLEAAALTLDEALTLVEDGLDLSIVLIFNFSKDRHVLLARPSVLSVEGLKGLRVGVENAAARVLVLDAAARSAGLTMDDIELIELTVDEQPEAFRTGTVDAVETHEPVRSKLLRLGARELFDTSKIPMPGVDVLVVRSDIAARRGETLGTLLEGYFNALDYLEAKPQDATYRIARRMQVSPAAVPSMYHGLYQPDAAENRELLAGTGNTMTANKSLLSAQWLPEER